MLIAQAVFLLECGQTDKRTDRRDWTPYSTPAAIQPAWVISEWSGHNIIYGMGSFWRMLNSTFISAKIKPGY